MLGVFCLTLAAVGSALGGALDLPTHFKLLFTGTNQAAVTWQDNASAETGYQIDRRTGDAGSWSQVQLTAASVTSWTDTAVPTGNTVYYRIRTRNGASASAWANIAVLVNAGDSDADGIPDATETTAGLDPTDWLDGTGDLDGDGVPNAWEYGRSTDMTNNAAFPTADVTVDPSVVTETATVKRTITAAINALSSSPPYKIIVVMSGVYNERITIPTGKKVALLAAGNGAPPEIRGFGTLAWQQSTVEVVGEAVIDGFRITRRDPLLNGFGVLVNTTAERNLVRISNCVIYGTTLATGVGNGTGIDQKSGRLAITHTTIYGNTRNGGTGASLYCNPPSTVLPYAIAVNSLFWNPLSSSTPEIYYVWGTLSVRNCLIRNGSSWGAITSDPLLNPRGYLTSGSPAIGAGGAGHGAPFDIDGEARDGSPDIGVDEFIDADTDELPDRFETGGDLAANGDEDADGLENLEEYEDYGTDPLNDDTDGDGMEDGDEITAGADPFNPDSDEDGMTDGYEHTHGLDPMDAWDRLGDADGDRIPNFWEFQRGTSASDGNSKPSTDWIVSPPQAGTGIYKATIQQAINAVSTSSGHYAIIEVRPGTYLENIDTSSSRKILLLADQQVPPVQIKAPATNNAVRLTGEAVIDGFRITRGADYYSIPFTGVFVDINTSTLPGAQAKVVNCLIDGHTTATGGGLRVYSGRVLAAHVTIIGNSATDGNGIAVGNNMLKLVNSIVWNPAGLATTQIHKSSSGTVSLTNSIVYGGEFGGTNSDPLLNPLGLPTSSSPAINAGAAFDVATKDYHGEARSGNLDMGFDEFVDGDSDGLPDWVEALGATTAGGDTDSDGLTNLDEYNLYASLAHVADTDGDGLNDSGEVTAATDANNPDTDNDSMPDGFEATHGLDPADPADALDDKDGDRIPNVYEWYHSTDPSLSSSKPSPHYTVDPAATPSSTVKNTITAATNAAMGNPYRVILVKSAAYDEGVNLVYTPILLLGEAGPVAPSISKTGVGTSLQLGIHHTVVDGIVVKPALGGTEKGVYITLDTPFEHARMVNCTVSGFYHTDGAGIHVSLGQLAVEHCTIFNNVSTKSDGCAGIHVTRDSKLRLLNSIVWNPRQASGIYQVYETTSGSVTVSDSIILGGEHGASGTDPGIEPFTGSLRAGSSAIDAGSASASLVAGDMHGETRDASPDIGADEFIDSDSDDLPDRWEQFYYASLTHADTADTDSDGLTNLHEFLGGLNPTLADSDGDGQSDLLEALATARYVYTATTDLDDDDGDGLNNAQEVLAGTNSAVADSNGDGIRDGVSWAIGINPMSTDSDGDGVSNADELLNGTGVLTADSDGDGVDDDVDVFPLDPSASTLPSNPGDMTAPTITLTKPAGAVEVP